MLKLFKKFQTEPIPANLSSGLEIQACPSTMNRPLNGGSPSPHSADSNAPTSSQSLISSALQSSRQSLLHDGQITPSISLIPIKQVRCVFLAFNSKSMLFSWLLTKKSIHIILSTLTYEYEIMNKKSLYYIGTELWWLWKPIKIASATKWWSTICVAKLELDHNKFRWI